MDCIFCKIVAREIPAKIVYENDYVMAFYDINPVTKEHILIIPKKHISSIDNISDADRDISAELFTACREIAKSKNMQADGYSLDDKRTPTETSDIPDIVARFGSINTPPGSCGATPLASEGGRARTEQSFFVPKAEIVSNGYDLSINKYKQSAYVEESYPHPREILAEIKELEREIADGLRELEALIDG